LKQDNSLRLFLASIGNRHEILFDESLHNSLADLWNKTKGLPLNWLKAQAVLIGLLLLLSFSRRRGPVRPLVTLPRTSPIEFADSMGALYEKAGATSAAIEAAQRRLFRILVREAGIAQATLELGPQAIAQALTQRLGGNWQQLATHLETAERIKSDVFSVRDSLSLVKALNEDAGTVRHRLHPEAATAAALQEAVTETN
jgi:hypothetical protein